MFEFYKGKRILVTGHTGFKGAWLTRMLSLSGAEVHGLSLRAEKDSIYALEPNLGLVKSNEIDIRDESLINKYFACENFDGIFHLAAQALVRKSYKNPIETFQTNVIGTSNLLNSANTHKAAKWAIVVTSDKVYENTESFHAYVESDKLGGKDPYSASKAATEMVVRAWQSICQSQSGLRIVTARAGNVIGGGDVSEDRIMPDLIRNFKSNQATSIRNPNSIRPWQHVLDPLNGYLTLGAKIDSSELNDTYNFGPSSDSVLTVKELANLARESWNNVPEIKIEPDQSGMKESGLLLLNSDKARMDLGWQSILSAAEAVKWTIEWENLVRVQGVKKTIDFQINKFQQMVHA